MRKTLPNIYCRVILDVLQDNVAQNQGFFLITNNIFSVCIYKSLLFKSMSSELMH